MSKNQFGFRIRDENYEIVDDTRWCLTKSGSIMDCVTRKHRKDWTCELNIGINDKQNEPWFIGDNGIFDNGDEFILKMEDFLEVSVCWIGEPECEDQARDLYRIENADHVHNFRYVGRCKDDS